MRRFFLGMVEFKSNSVKKPRETRGLRTNYFVTQEIYPWQVAPQQCPLPFESPMQM